MKSSYAIVLFIFIFSMLSTATNEMDIFNSKVQETGITDDDITEITNQAEDGLTVGDIESTGDEFSLFTGALMIIKTVKILALSVVKTFIILPTLLNYGIPLSIATIFQGITSYIEYLAITEFLSGRRVTQ